MINKHIEIVCSSRAVLSSMSLQSREAILDVLSAHYSQVGITIVNDISDLGALIAIKPDLVFLGMKFVPMDANLDLEDPEKIWISEYLEAQGIACTGSSQKAHEMELNKSLAKLRMQSLGVQTSPFFVASQKEALSPEDIALSYPLFVKPTNRGGGAGIDSKSLAHNFSGLNAKVESIAADYLADSLIEEFLPGREFSVALLKYEHSKTYSAMPLEIVAEPNESGQRMLSSAVKASDTEVVSEVTDENLKARICQLAFQSFHALGARDYGRIDIRLDADGTPHFLEANLIPSLIKGYGNFPKACMLNQGLEYESMILKITRLGLARSRNSIIRELDPSYLRCPILATPRPLYTS